MRTEEKKREAIRLKEAKNSPAATQAPVIAAPTPAPVEAPLPPRAEVADVQIEEPLAVKEPSPILVQGQSTEVVENTAVKNGTGRESAEAGQDVPQPSIEVRHDRSPFNFFRGLDGGPDLTLLLPYKMSHFTRDITTV